METPLRVKVSGAQIYFHLTLQIPITNTDIRLSSDFYNSKQPLHTMQAEKHYHSSADLEDGSEVLVVNDTIESPILQNGRRLNAMQSFPLFPNAITSIIFTHTSLALLLLTLNID